MPVLPKMPSVLLHFDDNLADYSKTRDIGGPVSVTYFAVATADASRVLLKNLNSIRNETIYFNGAKYIQMPSSADFDTSGSFTIRFWEYLISYTGNVAQFAIMAPPINTSMYSGLLMYLSAGMRYWYASSNGTSWNQINKYSLGAITYDQWIHWEIGYDADTKKMYIFKNGILLNTFTLSANIYYNSARVNCLSYPYSTGFSTSLIADFDFIVGVCEHTSSFTPLPVTSTEITKAVVPELTDLYGKFGNALYLDGTRYFTSELTVDTSNDFTISFWEYPINAYYESAAIAVNFEGSGVPAILLYNARNDRTLYLSSNGSNYDIASGTVLESISNILNKWVHWEICYKSSTKLLYVFLNGNLKHAVICPTPLKMKGYSVFGVWGTDYNRRQAVCFDEFLVLQGMCLHTDSFTPPDEPYTLPEQELVGYVLQAPSSGTQYSPVVDGHELKVLNSGVNVPVVCDGVIINIVKGYQNLRTLFGKPILPLTYGNQLQPTFAGVEMYMSTGTRNLAQYNGISIDSLYPDSNTSYNFDLLVTPTHIYKNQFAHVAAKYRFPQGLTGKYQLKVKDEIAIPWGASTDISTVDFNIMQSMLEYGKNPCRLEYLYSDGQFKFLDFEVTREEPQRIRVERTFKKYDGGYDGNYMRSAPNSLSKSPCFLVPDGQESTVIKTTDFTKVPLQKYTGVQGVSIDAEGAKILVTFDEGITYKSLIGDSWQTVSLDDIAADGMTPELVNSTIFARWLEIFQPVSLDFAIYLDNSVSNYADRFGEYLATTAYVASGNGTKKSTTYTANSDVWITKIFASGGANDHDKTVDSYTNGVWQEEARVNYGSGSTHTVDFIERQNKPSAIRINAKYSLYAQVYVSPKLAYLKSIVADITPRLKTGYAFIM